MPCFFCKKEIDDENEKYHITNNTELKICDICYTNIFIANGSSLSIKTINDKKIEKERI